PFAAGSRYLKRNVVFPPAGAPVTVVVNTAPLLASSWPTPPHTDAITDPCQLNTLFASPVGIQSDPDTTLYWVAATGTVRIPVPSFESASVIVTFPATVIVPVKLVLKLYPPFTKSPLEILIAPSIEDGPMEKFFGGTGPQGQLT